MSEEVKPTPHKPALWYISILVGVAEECRCPAVEPERPDPTARHYIVVDYPHEAHDVVPVRGEDDLPEGLSFGRYKELCRMFAAAPDLLAACEELLDDYLSTCGLPPEAANMIGRISRARAAIAKATGAA
jgi:hypothetical protein